MTATVNVHADDLYERLGLEREATRDEVRKAYQRLVRIYPPERAADEFKRIREAYETLHDPRSRDEYDTLPSPVVQRLLELAFAAFGGEEYEVAERYFKQALIQAPELGYVRNHLGLCYLHQERSEEAIGQFERLLRSEDPAPHVYANAGYAYKQAGLLDEAAQAFMNALQLGGDDVSYYMGLASVYVERKEYNRAKQLLERAIRADGKVDFEDLQFFTKLLEINLFERDTQGAAAVLARIRSIVTDQDQARFVAWKLGMFSQQLIVLEAFAYARPVAQLAHELQPQDGDYDALTRLATYLDQLQLENANGLVDHHPSFGPSGWLEHLKPWAGKFIREHRAFVGLKRIRSAPGLGTIYGVGLRLYGRRDPDPHTTSYVTTRYFTVLFVPVVPIDAYRVVDQPGGGWLFLGKTSVGEAHKVWQVLFWIALVVTLVIGVVSEGNYAASSRPTPSSRSSSYASPMTTEEEVRALLRGGSSGTNSSNASVPSQSVSPSGNSRPNADRAQIAAMESQLRAMELRLNATEADIDRLAMRMRQLESDAAVGIRVDEWDYNRVLREHNQLVDQYNSGLQTYNSLYARYSAAVNSYNSRR